MRKVLGGLFLFFIAAPVLGAVIWGAGIARAVLGGGLLEEVPREVIRQTPGLVEDLFEAMKQPGALQDPDARGWMAAAAASSRTPSQVFEEAGLYAWLSRNLDAAVTDVHRALRGELPLREVVLDLKPVKAALVSPPMRAWVTEIVTRLPPCDAAGTTRWQLAVRRAGKEKQLPACNPGAEVNIATVQTVMDGLVEFPDRVLPLQDAELPPGVNALRVADRFLWVLFLAPLVLLVAGAAIASTRAGGFVRWLGIGTLMGSLGALLGAWTTRGMVTAALSVDPSLWDVPRKNPFWTSEASHALGRRIAELMTLVVDRVFSPVMVTAWVVVAVGAVLVVLSFLFRSPDSPPPSQP